MTFMLYAWPVDTTHISCYKHGTVAVSSAPDFSTPCPKCEAVGERYRRMQQFKRAFALDAKIAAMSDRELAEAAYRMMLEMKEGQK